MHKERYEYSFKKDILQVYFFELILLILGLIKAIVYATLYKLAGFDYLDY